MTTETTYRSSAGTGGELCECGCAPCETDSCGLDCLEQPRFYCGQLLTDQDLTQLLEWTQDKSRLKRFVDGWGVVCGLGVGCDPAKPGHVLVNPGYAIDCCGADIVVCEETSFDLNAHCPELASTCERPTPQQSADPDSEFAMIDLYLRYAEQETAPRAAFGRSDCHDVRECEPSRIKEGFELQARAIEHDLDPLRKAAEDWLCRYRERLIRVLDHFEGLQEWGHTEFVRRFLGWLEINPLRSFCFLRERVCETSEIGVSQRMHLLLWLLQEARMTYLQSECHACSDDPGVPLARLLLKTSQDSGGRRCSIQTVDAYPPYRRSIERDYRPTPTGMINLGQIVWHRYEEACVTLGALGVEVAGEEAFVSPGSTAELRDMIAAEAGYVEEHGCSAEAAALFARCGQSIVLLVIDPSTVWPIGDNGFIPGERRVVGFRRGAGLEEREVNVEIDTRSNVRKKTATSKRRSAKRSAKK